MTTLSPELSVLLSAWEVQSVALDQPELGRAVEEIKDIAEAVRLADDALRGVHVQRYHRNRYAHLRAVMHAKWGTE